MKFTKILKSVIVENIASKKGILLEVRMTLPQMIDTYATKKVKKDKSVKPPKMDVKTLLTLIAADPTTKPENLDLTNNLEGITPDQMVSVRPGKYSVWIVKNYLDLNQKTDVPYDDRGYEENLKALRNLFLEDLYKITNDLKKYDRNKSNIKKVEDREISNLDVKKLAELVQNFVLDKRTTKEKKKEAAKTYRHPHADIVHVDDKWTVAKISKNDQDGRQAAVFYGGSHQEPVRGETRWCTSNPGSDHWYFDYLKSGPLYVIIPNNWTGKLGEVSGLPATRYQFHFKRNQFMDPFDHQIDLVKFLKENEGLKEFFKPIFMEELPVHKTDELEINSLSSGPYAKWLGIYGLEEIFDVIPENIKSITIELKDQKNVSLKLPSKIKKFKDLTQLVLSNCISQLPKEICECKSLEFLGLSDNPNLKSIPDCIKNLPSLIAVGIANSPVKLSQELSDYESEKMPGVLLFISK